MDSSSQTAEIASLRAVWQETRESLSKAKKLLSLKEESHAKAQAKLSADWQAALEAQQAESESRIKALQSALDANTAQFVQAVASKKEHQREQSHKEAELTATIADMQARLDALHEQQQRVLEEREQMMAAHQTALASHQALLARLRVEEAERMAQMEAEMKAKTSTLSTIQSRETSLEEEQIHATQTAAQAQRELEDRTRQLDRVLAEKRWIEADQHSLNDQLQAMKARVEELQKQLSAQQQAAKDKLQATQEQAASARLQLSAQQTANTQLQKEIDQLRAHLEEQVLLTTVADSAASHLSPTLTHRIPRLFCAVRAVCHGRQSGRLGGAHESHDRAPHAEGHMHSVERAPRISHAISLPC